MHHNTPQTCLPAQTRNSLCCREALYDSWWIYRTAGVKLIGGELPDDGTITNHEQQLKKDILYVNHVTCTAYRMNSRLSIKGTFLQGKEGSVILNSSRGPEFISRFSEQDQSYCKMFLLYIYRVVDTLIRSRSERWSAAYVSSTCCPRGSRSHDPACVAYASYRLGYTGRNLKQGFFTFQWRSCQLGWLTMSLEFGLFVVAEGTLLRSEFPVPHALQATHRNTEGRVWDICRSNGRLTKTGIDLKNIPPYICYFLGFQLSQRIFIREKTLSYIGDRSVDTLAQELSWFNL